MPIDQSEAIVLRTYNLADQDKIVVFLTRDRGLLRGVAKGARKFGNRFGSSLEPFSVDKVVYYEKERRELVTVSHCDLLESYFEIQKDLLLACILSYFAELIEAFPPPPSKDDVLYRLLLSELRCLEAGGDPTFATRYFEAWFLKINGFLPDLARCKKCRKHLADQRPVWLSPKRDGVYCDGCAPARKDEIPPEFGPFLAWIKKNPPAPGCPVHFQGGNLIGLRKILQTMITYHIEKEPLTLRFLQD